MIPQTLMTLWLVSVIFTVFLFTTPTKANAIMSCGSVNYSQSILNSPVKNILRFDSINKIFVLTQTSTLYSSSDGGISWKDETPFLQNFSAISDPFRSPGVMSIYATAVAGQIWAIGYSHQIWISDPLGTFSYISSDSVEPVLYSVYPHPTEGSYALGIKYSPGCSSGGECFLKLYLTKDLGQTWTFIYDDVFKVAWGSDTGTIIFTAIPEQPQSTKQSEKTLYDYSLFRFDDFGNQKISQVPHCGSFVFQNDILFLAVEDPDLSVSLFISTDEALTITKLIFGDDVNIQSKAFTILKNSESAIFINIQQSDINSGTTFTSSDFDQRFTVSLQRNHRSPTTGAVDFVSAAGLEGIYLSNAYFDPKSASDSNLRSLISFDEGSTWEKLLLVDPNCQASECSIQLLGKTNGSQIYSSSNSPGLIIGNAILGSELNFLQPTSLFISVDAAKSWESSLSGLWEFQVADHGSIVLSASSTNESSTFLYSTDVGLTWTTCSTNNPKLSYIADSISPHSDPNILKFLITGRNSQQQGVLTFVDLSSVYNRICVGASDPGTEDSDYELWNPSTPQGQCILGEQVSYSRRIRNANCYNSLGFQPARVKAICPCSRSDYECDGDCFMLDSGSGNCTNSCSGTSSDPTLQPSECKGSWKKTQGYRLLPDTKCSVEKGLNLLPINETCLGSTGGGQIPISPAVSTYIDIINQSTAYIEPNPSFSIPAGSDPASGPDDGSDGGPSALMYLAGLLGLLLAVVVIATIIFALLMHFIPSFKQKVLSLPILWKDSNDFEYNLVNDDGTPNTELMFDDVEEPI